MAIGMGELNLYGPKPTCGPDSYRGPTTEKYFCTDEYKKIFPHLLPDCSAFEVTRMLLRIRIVQTWGFELGNFSNWVGHTWKYSTEHPE